MAGRHREKERMKAKSASPRNWSETITPSSIPPETDKVDCRQRGDITDKGHAYGRRQRQTQRPPFEFEIPWPP